MFVVFVLILSKIVRKTMGEGQKITRDGQPSRTQW